MMTRKGFKLSRRALLRGAALGAVATVALPPLEAMLDGNGEMYAGGQPIPRRFGFFFWGNGVLPHRWTPTTTGHDWQPSDQLRPLAGVKDYVSVVSGMLVQAENRRGHHSGAVGILSGAPFVAQDPKGAQYASTFSKPSIDQVLADRLDPTTRFRTLEIGVDPRVSRAEGTTLAYLSHNGPDNANPPEYSPHQLFAKLFGEGFVAPGAEAGEVDPTLAVRRSVLDAVREDARRLQKRLGHSDRLRLDQHLEGISSLQQRLALQESAPPPIAPTCALPDDPGEIEADTQERQRLRSRAMADLLVMALACDQTRIWTNLFNGSVSGTHYWDIDPRKSFHGLTHDEPGEQPKVHECVVFIMEELAYLLQRLRDTPEGDGNLLDHSVILASSDVSHGRRHNLDNYPLLVCGKGGGTLRGNFHYRSLLENTSTVLLSACHAMGVPIDSFGHERGWTDKRCGAIMTG